MFQPPEISKLLIKGKACGIGALLSSLYGDCDSFNPDLSSENSYYLDEVQFKDSIEKTFLQIQKFLEE